MSKVVANVGLFLLLLAILGLAALHSLISASPLVIAGQVAAVALVVWARRSFTRGSFRVTADPAADTILRRGPYRYIRHPMYAAAGLFVWSSVLGHWSLPTAAIGVAVLALMALRIVVEERLLRAHYPDYRQYAQSTKYVIPFVL